MEFSKKREIEKLISRVKATLLGYEFQIMVCQDQVYSNGRFYLQCRYFAPCTKTGGEELWKGRKWYLSEFMTDDEIIKTAYCAFESAVRHEVMEGFKVDGKILFNPHVSFEALIMISDQEVKRKEAHNG
jgi:hypothetical protein